MMNLNINKKYKNMMMLDATKEELLKATDGQTNMSLTLGVSRQAVSKWLKNKIPLDRCLQIEMIWGIKCEKLRPDLNWNVIKKQINTLKVF